MEHCIVYFSNSADLPEEDLRAILEQSRRNNTQSGITGVMLYVRGSIVQVLEGKQQVVETLYGQIQQDDRHTNVIQVLSRPIEQRLFGQWSMGYETLTSRQLEEIRAIVDLDNHEAAATDPAILKMIKVFYDSNRYN